MVWLMPLRNIAGELSPVFSPFENAPGAGILNQEMAFYLLGILLFPEGNRNTHAF
jgi:hypothetical protein